MVVALLSRFALVATASGRARRRPATAAAFPSSSRCPSFPSLSCSFPPVSVSSDQRGVCRPGRLISERPHARFETGFVAVRPVHVPELGVRGHGAAARAYGDERAVAAFLPRREPLESLRRSAAPCL